MSHNEAVDPIDASSPPDQDDSPLRILVVDDDADIRLALESYFSMHGYEVTEASNGNTALELMETDRGFDLVLLDVMLPGIDGFEVLRLSQEMGVTSPVLMISGRGRQEDVLKGFGLGAHDYIVKPFEADELMARIQAILGRTMPPSQAPMKTYQLGEVSINFSTYEAYRGEDPLDFSELEFDILRYLIQNRGNVVSRKRLLEDAWRMDEDLIMHTLSPEILTEKIEEHIRSILHKVEPNPNAPRFIEKVYGQGYRLNA